MIYEANALKACLAVYREEVPASILSLRCMDVSLDYIDRLIFYF